MRRLIKRFFFTLAITVLLTVLFRGPIFRFFISYHHSSIHPENLACPAVLQQELDKWARQYPEATLADKIQFAQTITAKSLNFVNHPTSSELEQMIVNGSAHCVGYARFMVVCIQQLCKTEFEQQQLSISRARGRLHFMGFDLHRLFSSPFWKDHDYVMIIDRAQPQVLGYDPVLYDYLDVSSIKLTDWEGKIEE